MHLIGMNLRNYLFILFMATICNACNHKPAMISAQPSAHLSPKDVVLSQLEALKNNDNPSENHGIEIIYAFSTPKYRINTGSMERYIFLFQSGDYVPLIKHKDAQVSKHFVDGQEAQFFVEITAQDGKQKKYIFDLTKVKLAGKREVWLTEAIIPLKPGTRKPHRKENDNTIRI